MQDNVEYLREFIGKEWVVNEVKKVEDKSALKEVGCNYFNYHPFVQFHYELQYLIRKAEAFKENDVLMGEFWEKLNRTGYLVKLQKDKIIDENEFKSRLRSPEQFDDVLFELEVATILKKNNIQYNFKTPTVGDSNDITCFIDNRPLEVECKNKHILDEDFNRNNTFTHILCNALSEIVSLKGKVIEIEFDNANYEDIKTIVKEIKENLKDNDNINVLNKYSIRYEPKYLTMSIERIFSIEKVQGYYVIGKQKKSELYTKQPLEEDVLFRMVCKFPNENRNLKNLSSLLKKANKQLPDGGVVFLKVPHNDFDNIVVEIERMLKSNFSNIYCVKVVALEGEDFQDKGVKVSRKESLLLGDLKNCKLTKQEYDFLNSDIVFSIYK